MTPASILACCRYQQQWACLSSETELSRSRTKRMPQDQSQFWDLLALLAELQQSSLPSVLVEQVGDVGQCSTIVLRHRGLNIAILSMSCRQSTRVIVGSGDAVVVSLLRNGGGGGGSCCLLGMLVVTRLVHPRGRVALRVVVMLAVHVWIGHHLGPILLR